MRFLEVIGGWVNRYFSNEEAIYLVVLLAVAFTVLLVLGDVLAPVLTGLIIAFMLEGLVARLEALKVPPALAVYLTFLIFVGLLLATLLFLVPLLWRQLVTFANALPGLLAGLQDALRELPETFPETITQEQVQSWLELVGGELTDLGGTLAGALVTQLPSLVALLIYLVLVPISVFFFLKDRREIASFLRSLLPPHRALLDQVGAEMNVQIANYIRGKALEIVIVGVVTYVTFAFLGLNYSALLGLIVGLGVLVPFIGAAVVTLPVALVAFIQFGWTLDFFYVMLAYAIIHALDGNVLVPLMFSEAVDLHPITIIVAVLAFGGLWGIWGVFFAIPLATLVKAIYNAWPRQAGAMALDEDIEPLPEHAETRGERVRG